MSAAARAVLSEHSKSFALAGRLLPKSSYDDASVLYAFCRRADDAVDLGATEGARHRLGSLRRELASVYAGEAQTDPLLISFQELVNRRGIPERYPSALLDGLETDLGSVRFETLSELMLYAFRVAGVVGLMMCHVLEVTQPGALRRAAHLGIAMQLTNVCRDVAEDWQRGRLYIPQEVLAASGVPAGGFTSAEPLTSSAALARAVRHLLEMAEGYYRSGDRGLPALSARAAFAVRAARYVYSAIGGQLARRGYDPLRGRVFVSRNEKVFLVARAGIEELAARLARRIRRSFRRASASTSSFGELPRAQKTKGEGKDGTLLLDR